MDQSPVRTNPSLEDKEEEEDEWDTDGFVIPSLGIEEPLHQSNSDDASNLVQPSEPPSPKGKIEETIYLGPHGAPLCQSKQQEYLPASSTRKQRFRQKLKEADRRIGGTGRENKLENLQELVGTGKVNAGKVNGSTSRDWLDPHCHESQFEKPYRQ